MKNYEIKKFKQLSEKKFLQMLRDCRDEETFLQYAQDYFEETAYIYSELENIKSVLGGLDLDKFVVQFNCQFIDIVSIVDNELREDIENLSHHLSNAKEYKSGMIDFSGYSEEDTKTLFHNCLYHGMIGD